MSSPRMVKAELSPWMLDLRGCKSGLLTITELHGKLVYPSGSMIVLWKAMCECGNTHIVNSAKFNRGETKSCGCLADSDYLAHKDKSSKSKIYSHKELVASGHKFTSLYEQTFDKLTVIDLSHARCHLVNAKNGIEKKWIIYWNCQCSCGKVLIRSNRYLLWGKGMKSCGCMDEKTKNYRKRLQKS